jgi:hypothetical protein
MLSCLTAWTMERELDEQPWGAMTTAGRRPDADSLVDLDRLVGAYYDEHPDPSDLQQAVSFGTSGHRGSSLVGTFTEDHIVAISEAIARYRLGQGINGPLLLGRDTHALSEPAFRTAVEVSERLVRRAPVEDGGRLQALRRKLQWRTAPEPHSRAGTGTPRPGVGALNASALAIPR